MKREEIRPLYETFSKVQIRKFHDEGLKDAFIYESVPPELIKRFQLSTIFELWEQQLPLNSKLFVLEKCFSPEYKLIIDVFKKNLYFY